MTVRITRLPSATGQSAVCVTLAASLVMILNPNLFCNASKTAPGSRCGADKSPRAWNVFLDITKKDRNVLNAFGPALSGSIGGAVPLTLVRSVSNAPMKSLQTQSTHQVVTIVMTVPGVARVAFSIIFNPPLASQTSSRL